MNNTTYTGRYFTAMKQALDAVEVTLADGKPSDVESGFGLLSERCGQLKQSGGTLFFAGNGASAMMSSHMAVDFCKNAGVKSMAFNDVAFLTAIGNDLGYSRAFEMPLSMMGRGGDVLATISSSGNSPNVILAIQAARRLGMSVVTLSGMKPDNQSRALGDINFYVPGRTYGVAESVHAILLHCWLDHFMNVQEWEG